jgi:Na+-driven multidrug efflux pump
VLGAERRSRGASRRRRGNCGIVSQLVWAATLVAGFTGAGDRATLAIGQAIGAMGCLVMAFLLLRAGGEPIGLILVAAPPVLLFGWPIAWLAFGLAWTVIGFMLLLGLDRDESGALPA